MRLLLILAVLMPTSALPAVAQQTRVQDSVDRQLADSLEAETMGDYSKALAGFERVRAMANREQRKIAAEAAFHEAVLLEAAEDLADPSLRYSRAVDLYKEAIANGDQILAEKATSNLGVVFLKVGNAREAVAVLMTISAAGGPLEYLYQYNLARALEANGDLAESFSHYVNSIKLSARATPSIERALALAPKLGNSYAADSVDFCDALLEVHEADLALREASAALSRFLGLPEAERLLVLIARGLSAAEVSPDTFKREWGSSLDSLVSMATNQDLKDAVAQLETAYLDAFPLFRQTIEAQEFFRHWVRTEEQRQALSGVLKRTAVDYDRARRPEMALTRYLAEWLIDPSDTEAALNTVILLNDERARVDPDGRTFDNLITSINEDELSARQDELAAFRWHMILGTVYERRGEFGSPNESRGSMHHWLKALEAERRVRDKNPSFPKSPALYEHLGDAYSRLDQSKEAVDAYEEAITAYVAANNQDAAISIVDRVGLRFPEVVAASEKLSEHYGIERYERMLPTPFLCGDRDDLRMSNRDRACYWWTNLFNAQVLLGAGFTTALDPIFNGSSAPYWGQGARGFSKRFGTRVAQSMTKGTGQALVGALFKEDPRFYVSRKDGFWPRFGFALRHTLVVKNDSGREQLSAGRLAGAFSSGFVGLAWTPDPINTTGNALVRTGTAMGGFMAGSLWKEFQPDIVKLAVSILRRSPKATPATGAKKP